MSTIKYLSLILIIVIITSCSNYHLTGNMLIDQLEEHQNLESDNPLQQYALIDYPSNNLTRIKCYDKDQNLVWLYPDKNTQFQIIRKSDGKKIKAYFDTVILQNDTLFGLRSRLIGGLKKIAIDDIERVEIYAELPKTEPIMK